MKKRTKILFLGDHRSREVQIARYTLTVLSITSDVTYEIHLMPQDTYATRESSSFITIMKLRPDVIVTPTLNKAQAWLLLIAYLNSSRVVIQHSEQFLINIAERHKLASLRFLKSTNVAHLSWTKAHKGKLTSHGVKDSHAFITGSPKLASFSSIQNIRRSKNCIGFVSNFLAADLDDLGLRNLAAEFGISTCGNINTRISSLRSRFLTLLTHYALLFPEKKFIVRTHPGERTAPYLERIKGIKNIEISNDGEFSEFLAHVDAIVMHDSTSLFESLHHNIPVYSVNLGPVNPDWIQQPSNLFKDGTPRGILTFINGIGVENLQRQNSYANALEVISEMKSYEAKIEPVLQKIVKGSEYKIQLSSLPWVAYRSFLRGCIIQSGDRLCKKIGLDIMKTDLRNQRKIERYGSALKIERVTS